MRFITGFIIGSLIGYYSGATHFNYDIMDKLPDGKEICQYESIKTPRMEEYLADTGMYGSKLEKLSENNDMKLIRPKYELNI